MIINCYVISVFIWEFFESYVREFDDMARQEMLNSHYSYKKKVYVGKMKRQGNQNSGIMAQMMYYSK